MKLLVFLALALSGPAAFGQQQTFRVSSDSSEVKIRLNTTHEVVNGMFNVRSGSINFDRNSSQISGLVIVIAGSGKTGNDNRDKKMNEDILKVGQFPTISFAPKRYDGTIAASGDSTVEVDGVFTLLGTVHDLTIPMQIHIDGSRATVKGQFTIPYVEWGIKNPSFLIWKADNDVKISLNLVGQILN